MQHIQALELFILCNYNFVPFDEHLWFLPPPTSLYHQEPLCFYEFDFLFVCLFLFHI